jgi:hypothetical protein
MEDPIPFQERSQLLDLAHRMIEQKMDNIGV